MNICKAIYRGYNSIYKDGRGSSCIFGHKKLGAHFTPFMAHLVALRVFKLDFLTFRSTFTEGFDTKNLRQNVDKKYYLQKKGSDSVIVTIVSSLGDFTLFRGLMSIVNNPT